MLSPARHPSPIGRTAPRVGVLGPVKGEGASAASALDGGHGGDCRAARPRGRVARQGDPCPEPRALRERASRCLHGRDPGKAALLYRLAEYHSRELDGQSPETTELAALAEHCEQLTRHAAKKGRKQP
ncbi:hypothetical protein GCM10009016_10370 [Halomonas beimenensis]